eukprot:11122785-Lingulodinium_polyedra.AAC.1
MDASGAARRATQRAVQYPMKGRVVGPTGVGTIAVVGPGGMVPLSASSSATLAAQASARTELAPRGMSQ